jgi:hypothetical protein
MSQSGTLTQGTKRNLDGTTSSPAIYYQPIDSSTKYLAYTIQRPSEQMASHS